jgi:S-adenosylmethionine-dependent methyltransferase
VEMARTIAGRHAAMTQLLLSQCVDASVEIVGAHVLDCGGGTGAVAVALAEAGADVTVVDLSVDALATLERRAAEAGVSERVHYLAADLESADFDALLHSNTPVDGFEIILAHEVLDVLSSVSSASTLLGSLTQSLRSGGFLSLVVPNPVSSVLAHMTTGDHAAAVTLMRQLVSGSEDSTFVAGVGPKDMRLAINQVRALCASAGLRVERLQGIGVFTELVSGNVRTLTPDDEDLVEELERIASELSPFRDIASRLWIVARRS